MAQSRQILILSYTFPPSPSIGGRRWAKFAKHLKKAGNSVFVLKAKIKNITSSNSWNKDVENLDIYQFKSNYPRILESTPTSLIKKSFYHLTVLFLRYTHRGFIYDRSIFCKKTILSKASRIIEDKNIDTLIVSGAPFRLLYYATLLKKKYPEIRLISDLRDPWTWSKTGYGYHTLSQSNLSFEKRLEQKVIKESDLITAPVQPMIDYLQERYSLHQDKIVLLPHAFDEDDIDKAIVKETCEKIKLIYGGTIYQGSLTVLHKINDILNKGELKIQFDIYTNTKVSSIDQGTVNIVPSIDSKSFLCKVGSSNYFISIVPDVYKDFIATKYYEIIACRTPIILISEKGLLSEFIIQNNLGYHITHENVNLLVDILSGKAEIIKYNNKFPIEEYSFTNISKLLTTYF